MGRSVDEPRLRKRQRASAHEEPAAEAMMADGPRHGAASRAAQLDTRELQLIGEQQERVLADVRASLEQFRQRSAMLAKDYVRAIGRPPAGTLGRWRR